jgi:hypothetical protein
MDAKTPNTAESTPPAVSDGSRPEELGADTGEMFSKGDLLSELGLKPDGQIEAPTVDQEASDDTETTDAEQETAEADDEQVDATAETDTAEAESEKEPAQSDDAATETGESETPNEEQPKEGEAPGKENPEVRKRIDELTYRAKTAEEREAKLREEVTALRAHSSGALDAGTLATVEDFPTLQLQRQKAFQLQQWAIEHPDGGVLPGGKDGDGVELSREETARIHAQTAQLLARDIPQRESYLYARSAADAEAVSSYPWLKSTTGGWGATVQSIIEGVPVLRQMPNYRLVAANAYVGEKLRQAGVKVDDALIARLKAEQQAKQPAAAGQPAKRADIPPRPPASAARPGSVPPRMSPRAAEQKANRKRVVSTRGDEGSIEASIASKL